MLGFKILPAIFLTLLATATANVVERQQQDCAYTCGSNCYKQKDIDSAVQKGYSLHQSGSVLGNGKYPHQYKNFEKFDFATPAPWYEFPILTSASAYSGGSPGPDRVIFDNKGQLDSLITHSGAKGNNFVACKQGKQQSKPKQPDDRSSGSRLLLLLGPAGGGLVAVAAALTALALV